MLSEQKAKMMNAQLWELETGLTDTNPSADYVTSDILSRLIDVLHKEKGFQSVKVQELSEGYEWGEEEKKEDKFAFMKNLKGRK